MKKLIILFGFILLLSCDEDQIFENSGRIVSKEITVGFFNKISISEGIELHISDAIETQVIVKAGENCIDDIRFTIIDSELKIDAKNAYTLFKSYEPIKIYISINDLDTLYSASQFNVYSDNTLNFSSLNLQSGMFDETASGEFHLQVNCINLVVEDNRATFFEISGAVENLVVAFYNGDERFEGSNLVAQNVYVFQRSSNDIIVNPQQKITGTIFSTGNVILKNEPPIIEVEELYQGRLILN